MNIVYILACALCALSVEAQIPFTARAGLPAAQRHGGNSMPSAMGTAMLSENGTSQLWYYAFRARDRLIVVQVSQQAPNDYSASELPQPGDTTNLPVYINATPLPDSIIDSDSAMRIFSASTIFQQWHAQHSVGTQVLMAGHLRDGSPLPSFTPVWIYRAVDQANTIALNCFCSSDGTSYGCGTEMIQRGTFLFSVRDGLQFARNVAGTNLNPCLVGTFVNGADTIGKSEAWGYIFPKDTGDSLVLVFGLDQGIYHGSLVTYGDTTENLGFYIRSAPFADGWLNSTDAMERIRQHQRYRETAQIRQIDRIMMIGGRVNASLASMLNLPVGTAIWVMSYNHAGPDSLIELLCWCNLEPVQQPFVDCNVMITSVKNIDDITATFLSPNPATDLVTIRTKESPPIEHVAVYDVFGREHNVPYTIAGSSALLAIPHLAQGTYIVEVQTHHRSERLMLQVVR